MVGHGPLTERCANATTPMVHISRCFRCGLPMPLRSPVGAEIAVAWICVGCGARFQAVRLQSCSETTRCNVRPAGFEIEFVALPAPPTEMERFLATLRHDPEAVQRYAPRQVTALGVGVLPIDDQFAPCGDGFRSFVHAIDTTGAALLHVERVRCPYLALKIFPESPNSTQLLLRVKRCAAAGAFYEVEGPFVSRVGA